MPRLARKRGRKAEKRGLSAEQIPVLIERDEEPSRRSPLAPRPRPRARLTRPRHLSRRGERLRVVDPQQHELQTEPGRNPRLLCCHAARHQHSDHVSLHVMAAQAATHDTSRDIRNSAMHAATVAVSACRVQYPSKNRTGCPVRSVTRLPSHMTRLPRTTVPTGQPVTVTPS